MYRLHKSYCDHESKNGYKRCFNVEIGPQTPEAKKKYKTLLIVALIFGEIYDIIGWLVSLVPAIGDVLGNAILGNIFDVAAFMINYYLYGPYAFYGASEFIDVITQWIPGIGDAISLIEILPGSAFPAIFYHFIGRKAAMRAKMKLGKTAIGKAETTKEVFERTSGTISKLISSKKERPSNPIKETLKKEITSRASSTQVTGSNVCLRKKW